MGPLTLAAVAEPTGLIAIIVALAAGGPATAFTIYRFRKMGPLEREDTIAAASDKAVSMMRTTLDAAAAERQSLIDKVEAGDRERHRLVSKVSACEKASGKQRQEIVDLRRRVAQLERRVEGSLDSPA